MPFVTGKKAHADLVPGRFLPQIRWKAKYHEDPKYKDYTDRDFHYVVVVEDPPKEVRVGFKDLDRIVQGRYLIRKPWSYFTVHLNRSGSPLKAFIFFSYERLSSRDDRSLLYVPLPNMVYGDTYLMTRGICLGNWQVEAHTIEEKCTLLHERFWTSRFTGDIAMSRGVRPKWGSGLPMRAFLLEWERQTRDGKEIKFSKANERMSSINRAVRYFGKKLYD